jgi:hypothetical protein
MIGRFATSLFQRMRFSCTERGDFGSFVVAILDFKPKVIV